jgi:hypothetical protein
MQPVLHFLKPVFLHVPDGLLSLPVAVLCWIVSALLILLAVRRSKGELGERQVPLDGCYGRLHLCSSNDQLPGCRRDQRAPVGRGLSSHHSRALGGHAGHDQRHHGPGAAFPGRRAGRYGSQYPQHGLADRPAKLRACTGQLRAAPEACAWV